MRGRAMRASVTKSPSSLETYFEDEDISTAYKIWSKPENFLEEGEFRKGGDVFKYRFWCPLCSKEFLFNGKRIQVLGRIVDHAWDHICYFEEKYIRGRK